MFFNHCIFFRLPSGPPFNLPSSPSIFQPLSIIHQERFVYLHDPSSRYPSSTNTHQDTAIFPSGYLHLQVLIRIPPSFHQDIYKYPSGYLHLSISVSYLHFMLKPFLYMFCARQSQRIRSLRLSVLGNPRLATAFV